jgi:hypothetical protein
MYRGGRYGKSKNEQGNNAQGNKKNIPQANDFKGNIRGKSGFNKRIAIPY